MAGLFVFHANGKYLYCVGGKMRFKSCSTHWYIILIFIAVFSLANIPLAHADSDRKGFSKEADRDEDRHERLRKSARKLIEAQERGEDITTYVDDLDKNVGEIEQEDIVNKKRFDEIENKLSSLNGVSTVLARHREVRGDYEKKSSERKGHIEALKKAHKLKDPPDAIRQKVQGLIDFLEKHKITREHDIKSTDTRLPWRMAQPGELLILGDVSGAPQQGVSPVSSVPASVDDLAATADVQITPDIQALAASLNHSPLEIFRHVYNNYNYTPYYGSMKGSLDTYLEKEGNDFDLSSLLIALFRASNIPARYVRAQILVPIERIQNQLGIDDPMAAAKYLSSARIPASYYVSGGRLSHVQLQHVYVEAFVPYTNYRGSGEDDKGKVWLPFDPAFKQLTVTQQGMDIASAMNHDWKSFTSDYIADLRNVTPLEFYRTRVEDFIGQNYPEQTLDTLKRKSEIRTMKFDFLPNTLPYKTVAILDRFAAIPSELRHTVRFTIPGVLDHATTLPEISGRRITLTFTGATAADQTVIDAYGGIFKTPPYLLRVIPQLRIGGVKVAEGSPVNAAAYLRFSIDYGQPGGVRETFGHHVLAGSYNAVGITTGKVRPEFLSIAQVEPSDEVYLAKMVHSLAMKYHDALGKTRQTLNDTMRMQSKTFLTEALVSTHEEVAKVLGDIPVSFEQDGFMIDAKELAMAAVPIDGRDMEKKRLDFSMTFGFEASYQENRVFEDNMFWVEGTSAVKGLQVLAAQGVPIAELEPYITYENPNLPDVVVADINDALNMGWKVMAPEDATGLSAVPYIKYDEKTGSSGFMIAAAAGGLAQETIDITWFKDSLLQYNIGIDFEIYAPQNPMLVAMGDAFEILVKCIARGVGIVAETEAWDWVPTSRGSYQNGVTPLYTVLPGQYRYVFNGKDLFKFNVWNALVKQPKNVTNISIDNNGDPVMPNITLNADILGATFDQIDKNRLQICWSGKLEYHVNTKAAPYRSRKGLDKSGAGLGKDGFYIPVPEPPDSPYVPSKPDCKSANLDYVIDWKNMFGGGKLVITTQVKYAGFDLTLMKNAHALQIEGELATPVVRSQMISYLKQATQNGSPSLESILGSKDVLFALACVESYGANHFWSSIFGDPKKAVYPTENSTGDGGFGIMQLTNGGSLPIKVELEWLFEDGTRKPAPPEYVASYEQIWNWKKNIDASIEIVKEKYNMAIKWSDNKKNKMCKSYKTNKYQVRMGTYSLFRGYHYLKCDYNNYSEEYEWTPTFNKNSRNKKEVEKYYSSGVSEADKAVRNENKATCQ